MMRQEWDDFLRNPPDPGPVSFTVGVFDGVHRGHQALLHEVTRGEESFPMVFTFANNPFAVLRPKVFLGYLQTLPDKLERMEKFGVKGTVIIDFSPDFSKLTGKNFLTLLLERMNVRKLVLGSNHKLGQGGDMGPDEARRFCEPRGCEVAVVPAVRIRKHRVSSTRIRYSLLGGEMDLVEELLGAPYALDLQELPWKRDSERIVVERKDCPQILPPPGSYTVKWNLHQDEFATELVLDHDRLEWKQPANVPVEKIFFCNSD